MKTLTIFIITIFITSLGIAQTEQSNNVPHLNDHYFIPNMNVPSPFTNSHFGMNLGIASSSEFENVILVIEGEKIIGLKGSLIFADLNFDYQQKIKDWIAFYANVGLTARIGTELQSMLTQGVNTVTSFRMGWLVKLVQKEKYMLSGSIQINNYSANFINIGEFIEDLVRDSTVTSISKNVPILNGGLGLRFAYGINELFGFQAHGTAVYGESFERGVSDLIYQFGGSFDMNLAAKTKVPLGLSAFFTASSLPDIVQVKGKSATNTGIKISYTGGPHINLGLELSRSKIPIPNVEEKINTTGVFITSKYYFN